jgi:hypothetical protein
MNDNASNEAEAGIQFSVEEAKFRLIKENFISQEDCRTIIKLVEEHGNIGDGYQGNPHPHTASEIFGGYSLNGHNNATRQSLPGHREALEIMLKVRNLLKSHYGLPFLWLEYGHLVFREPVAQDANSEAEEFSHPWHYDNQSEGVKHRTHTAILYLNGNFEGGHTRFQETSFGPFREVQPEPGKLISFDVDKNAHGVSKLTSGKRYVLNMWFSTHWRMIRKHRKIFQPL